MSTGMYVNPLRLPNTEGGIGDPFVLRHNGRYYLYPSSSRNQLGVRVWVSEDLVHWSYGCTILEDSGLENMYAPEVWAYNGRFLLVGSPMGQGHYLFEGDSPMGPFRLLRSNFGLVIDGSIFQDDNGSLYFTHAEYPCIHGHHLSADGELTGQQPISGTGMGHWTEGPGIFKRGDKYYITMTGNHLLSRAYRVDYAISDAGPLGPYQTPKERTLLVNTDRHSGSLGHSSNVIGPDLDSYWICYHNFEINELGVHVRRDANLDRMLFNNERLTVSGPSRHLVQVPARPTAFGWVDDEAYQSVFKDWADGKLLSKATSHRFTAEANFVPGDRTEIAFAYCDEENYQSLVICDGFLTLSIIVNGKPRVCTRKPLLIPFDTNRMHVIRLEIRQMKVRVFIDAMHQFSERLEFSPVGLFGVRGAKRLSYMAFSPHASQSSDYEHFHTVPGGFDGALFSPYGNKAARRYDVDELGPRPEDGMRLRDAGDRGMNLVLKEKEQVTYRINVANRGPHHVKLVGNSIKSAKISLSFASEILSHRFKGTGICHSEDVGVAALSEGLQSFTLACAEGELEISRIEVFPVAPAINDAWSGLPLCMVAQQVEGMGSPGFIDRFEGLQMDREVQAMALFGDRFLCDGYIEASIRFRGDGRQKGAGLFVRLSENSYHPDQIPVGHRGYYIGFDMSSVHIARMNFDAVTLASSPCCMESEVLYRIRVAVEGGNIKVFVNDMMVLRHEDPVPLPYGRFGAGSFGSRITVERVEVCAR